MWCFSGSKHIFAVLKTRIFFEINECTFNNTESLTLFQAAHALHEIIGSQLININQLRGIIFNIS